MNSVLKNLENSVPDDCVRYYYCLFIYKLWVQTGVEDFSLKERQRRFTQDNLTYLIEILQDWIMGETVTTTYPVKKDAIEDVQEVSKIEFYYLDILDDELFGDDDTIDDDTIITVSGFNKLPFPEQVDIIKQYGVEASPQEYEALKRELYLID